MPMQRERYIAIWLRLLAQEEIKLARNSKKLLKNQASKAATAFGQTGHAGAQDVISDFEGRWRQILIASYTTTMSEFAHMFANKSGIKGNFQFLMQSFISRQAVAKARYLTQTSKDDLAKIIADGNADGLGSEAIAQRIVTEMGSTIADTRARTIARTETHMAAGYGVHAQASQTNIKMTKTWVAVFDERTRESHVEANNQTVDQDAYFNVGQDQLLYPGDPDGSAEEIINCRCAAIYEPASVDVIFQDDEE